MQSFNYYFILFAKHRLGIKTLLRKIVKTRLMLKQKRKNGEAYNKVIKV